MLFLASMGETELTHDIFFEFSLGTFEVVEAEGGRLVKEAASFGLNDLERPKWELKKMSWVNPVFPIDAKNSIDFFVQFFLS